MLFQKTKTIIIVGASRFGAGLAGRLSGRNTRNDCQGRRGVGVGYRFTEN